MFHKEKRNSKIMAVNTIQFKNVWHIKSIVSQLTFLNNLKKGDTVNIKFEFNATTIMPQYLAIIVSAINNAKAKGVNIVYPQYSHKNSGHNIKRHYNNYASRMNFYKLLGIKSVEKFNRKNSDNNFIEITQMDIISGKDKPDMDLVSEIIKIIKKHFDVDETVWSTLNFCLWELVDNIKNHSGSNAKYTLVAQYYPKKEEIRFCIADNGIGIHRALTETEGSRYKNLTPYQSISMCTNNSVTDGKGAGFGLYGYKNFVKANHGQLIIYSGNYYQEVKDGKTIICNGANWQGTIIYNVIKTKNKVNYNDIFDGKVPTTVTECEECINNLW